MQIGNALYLVKSGLIKSWAISICNLDDFSTAILIFSNKAMVSKQFILFKNWYYW